MSKQLFKFTFNFHIVAKGMIVDSKDVVVESATEEEAIKLAAEQLSEVHAIYSGKFSKEEVKPDEAKSVDAGEASAKLGPKGKAK